MSDAAERLQKMQVLLRLRKLEHDQQSFRYLHCENERVGRARVFEQERSRYQAVHTADGLNPDTYMWRLAAIELLRQQAQLAADELADAMKSLEAARCDLHRAELESRLAQKSRDDASQLFLADCQQQEFTEALDLQLFREKRSA